MKKERKTGTRILTLLLAFSMAASTFGTMPVYAMEPATMNIEASDQEAAQSEVQGDEDIQEEVKEETDIDDSSIMEDTSGSIVDDSQNGMEDDNGNPEQPRAPADEFPVADEGSNVSSEMDTDTEQTDTYAVNVGEIEHGEASANTEVAAEGDSVTITVVPDAGYQVQSFSVKMEDGTELEYSSEADSQSGAVLYTFIMPAGAVTAEVIIEETAPGQYKIKEQFPSAETRVVLQQLDGTERVLTKEEMDELIKAEEAKIDNGTSNLTKDSASMSSGGLSLGEALLASAAGAIIGSWIGSKLFNNQNFANQQRNAFSNQSAYQRSVNSFNNRATSAPNSASSRSGFFGGQKSGAAAGSQSYGS